MNKKHKALSTKYHINSYNLFTYNNSLNYLKNKMFGNFCTVYNHQAIMLNEGENNIFFLILHYEYTSIILLSWFDINICLSI